MPTAQSPHEAPGWAPLPRSFYARDVLTVARECIGAVLVSRNKGQPIAARIVEAEAYRGPDDRAAHSWAGRRTSRTEAMFGEAGHAYVFFLYGKHWNFNLVTGARDQPHAVLVRAVEPLLGADVMATRRGMSAERRELTNGPGKLCQAFGIDREDYGRDLTEEALFLSAGAAGTIRRSARIGVDYAGSWAARPWRFYEAGNRYVSGTRAQRS